MLNARRLQMGLAFSVDGRRLNTFYREPLIIGFNSLAD